MVVRLHNLSKWDLLKPGEVLEIGGANKVRVDVNCETDTRFDVVHGEGEEASVTFLTVVRGGMEVLEFRADPGSHLVASSDGEVWYFTNEGDELGSDREAVSFTRVMNRRARNPEMERMMFKMEQNANARFALIADQVAAMVLAAGVKHDTATGELDENDKGSPAGVQAEPSTDAGASGDSVKPAAKGEAPAAGAKPAVSA